jgi:hypothetical protein
MMTTTRPTNARVRFSYTDAEQEEREKLIALLEAEKQVYLGRIAPHLAGWMSGRGLSKCLREKVFRRSSRDTAADFGKPV